MVCGAELLDCDLTGSCTAPRRIVDTTQTRSNRLLCKVMVSFHSITEAP